MSGDHNMYASGNQPAFPFEYYDKQLYQNRVMAGMTLRDYFAAKAMQGIVSRGITDEAVDRCASNAYKMADAMMKAREA